MLAATELTISPWRFQLHLEVWILVASLIALYVYVARKVGPTAVRPGTPVLTRLNIGAFVGAITLLWLASDWPIHDIGEGYLYSVHMFQHMALTYFMPPLILLATPEWFMRILIGNGRVYGVVRWLTKPIVAGVVFNAMVMITHVPGVVNTSVEIAWLHYLLHFMLVMSALLMWMPVCGPFRELHIGPGAKMIYLFLQSVVPTVPAGWLTFADGVVYKHYDIPIRVWGVSATHDQQIAGAIMKIGGGMFLWIVVIFLFFKRFAANHTRDNDGTYRREGQMPTAEIIGHADEPLTYAQVTKVFETVPAPPDPDL